MPDVEDFPVEVTLTDGSQWIVYYRCSPDRGFGFIADWIEGDVRVNRRMPAEDLDRVQRRQSQIMMGAVVSFREALDHSGEAGSAPPNSAF